MPELYRPAFIHDFDIEITEAQDWVIGFRCLPRNDQGALYLEDTTGYLAVMSIFAPDPDGTDILTVDSVGGEIAVGYTPGVWVANTAYGVGQKVVPTTLNGFVYECTVAGTSHATTQPVWPIVLGNTVTDGTVTWRCETNDSQVCNLSIFLSATVTASLPPWGRGWYTLRVKDTFNHSWLHIDGAAYYRRSALGAVG